MHEAELSFSDTGITAEEVYRAMGYGDTLPDAEVQRQTELIMREAAAVACPRFAYLTIDGIIKADEQLLIGPVILHFGKIIGKQLRRATRFAVFAAGAGEEFDVFLNGFRRSGDIVSHYLADALGSCLAERAADCMEEALERELGPGGLRHTNRFSPGYCEWAVAEQRKLFSLFPVAEPCGIRLTDSCLMLPVKSVSGIIGIGPDVRKTEYGCGLCTLENCYRRKFKTNVTG